MSKQKTLLVVLAGAVVAIGALFAVRAAGTNPDRILARAEKYFEAKAFDEARLEYFKVLRVDPMNARAIRQLGLTWTEMGAPVQSGLFLTKASEQDPADLIVRQALAKALLSTNQYANARAQALTILGKQPADGEALLLLANTSLTPEQLAEANERLGAFNSEKSAYFHLVTALLAGRKGDLPRAKSSLDLALAIDPKLDTVHLALATYHEAKQEREAMLESLKQASEVSSGRAPRLLYARALAKTGKGEEAIAMVRKITESSRFYLPAWTLLAELSQPAKDVKATLEMLNEVLSRDATNPEARMLRATVLLSDGKAADAVKEMEDLGRIYNGNIGIKMVLARSYLGNSDAPRATATLEEVLRMAPDYIEANLLLAQINLSSGAAAAASEAMERLLQKRPGLAQAEQLLVSAYQAQGRLDDANRVLQQQIGRDAGQPGPHFALGMLLRQQGKADEALASLEKAQALAPKDQTITFQLIELDLARKDFASAHRRAEAQDAQHPGDWSPPYLLGKVFSAEEKWDEAEKALLKALAIQPDSLTIYNLLLDGYMKQGRIPEVITRLEAFLEKKPQSTPQRLILALLYQQTKKTDQEVAAYEQILRDEPNMVTALNNLAYLYAGPLNDLVKAQELAARARTAQPASPAIADTLGWILYQRKDFAQALPLIEEAAAKIPDNPEILYHLGMARGMQGQKETARTALEKALVLKTDFPGADEAKAYLAQLSGGDQAATLESLTERLKTTPGDVTARTRLAQLQEAAGKFAEAAASYQQALESNAGLVEALIALSRLYLGPLDDAARATEFARRARALDGQNPTAARALGEAVLRQGDFRYAYNLLGEASRTTKDDPDLQSKLASAAYGLGKVEDARKVQQAIVDQSAKAPQAEEAKRFLVLTGAPAGLTGDMVEQSLKENPHSLPALMARTALQQKAGSFDEAVATCERLLKQQEGFVPAQKQLASLLSRSPARLDEALRLAEKARQALPDDPELARTLGIIHYQKGTAEPALRLLKESDAKSPLDAEGLFYLGMAELGAEHKAEGIAVLQRALTAELPEALRQQAKEAIAKSEAAPN